MLEKIIEIINMGKESCVLSFFLSLDGRGTVQEQIDALKCDKAWQEKHHAEIMKRIDLLIHDIENN